MDTTLPLSQRRHSPLQSPSTSTVRCWEVPPESPQRPNPITTTLKAIKDFILVFYWLLLLSWESGIL